MQFDLSGMGHEVVDDLCSDISKIHARRNQSTDLAKTMAIHGGRVWVKKRPYSRFACSRSQSRSGEQYLIALDRFLTSKTRTGEDQSLEHEVDIQKLIYCAEVDGHVTLPLKSLIREAAGIT
jgi:hypothetical protein